MKKTVVVAVLSTAWVAGWPSGHVAAAEEGAENEDVFTAQLPEEGSEIAWGRAVAILDRPMNEVLPIVLDYANYVQFMPNFKKSQVLAQRGARAMVYMEVSVAKGALTLWGQLNLAERLQDDESRVVEARLMEGNIDAFNASWTLTPIDGGARTMVEFKLYVDPDMPLPSSIFSRENERAAGNTVRALRTRLFDGPRESS